MRIKESKPNLFTAIETNNLPDIQRLWLNDPDILFSPLDSYLGTQAIHIACETGFIQLAELLLEKRPSLINQPDNFGNTPLIYAAKNGNKDIVNFLIAKGADLCGVDSKSELNALMWAITNCHHEVAWILLNAGAFRVGDIEKPHLRLIILEWAIKQDHQFLVKTLLEIGIYHVLNINVQSNLLFIAIEHSSLVIIQLLIDENRNLLNLMSLVEGYEISVTPKSIGYYKTASGRRPSFFTNINRETGEATVYNEEKELGMGAHGRVRAFVNSKGKRIAIKSPRNNWVVGSDVDRINGVCSYADEVKFMKKASDENDDTLYTAFSFKENVYYTLRATMPFVDGESFWAFSKKTDSLKLIIEAIMGMTHALIRLHEKGIVHGDIKEDNILISMQNNELNASFVDCGYSYYLTDEKATFLTVGCENSFYWAPERRHCVEGPAPCTSQDIFSFGDMLRRVISGHKQYQVLINTFPSVMKFVNKAVNIAPCRRPTLQPFYMTLSQEYDCVEMDLSGDKTNSLTEMDINIMDQLTP